MLPDMKEAKVRSKKNSEVIYLEQEKKSNLYAGKKYFLRTYGCQMNVHDSEEIKAILENLGYTETDELEDSDIVVLNTCAIRENAHDKVFGYLGRCKHLKATTKKDLIVCIGGCMAQEEVVVNELKTKHSYVDIIFGTHNIHELATMIKNVGKERQDIKVYSIEGNVYENIDYKRDSKITAWVNIMYGCDKFCTYCIVPYTRGKQRSRRACEIVREVEKLVSEGYQEVTLLGQNVNAYGKDLESEMTFAGLLEAVAKTNIPRVRFVTSHPWDFTDEMIDVIAKYDNIMPSVHLPVQSGSSRILKLMGRRYTKESYLELFHKIKDKVPGVTISTDIIVGFPGETEEDFLETLDLVRECQYDNAFTFVFSKREGTPACKLADPVALKEKEERLQRLNEVVNHYFLENNKKLVGKEVKVLVEGISDKKHMYYGYSDTNKLVNFSSEQELTPGDLVMVKITDAKTWSLDGEIVE